MALVDEIPATMKAAQGKFYGDIDEMLSVQQGVAVPRLADAYLPEEPSHPLIRYAIKQDRKTHMIIKTLAVALAPGDCRVLSGKTRLFQGPPSFPYVPGGDCCGIVVETAPDEAYFKKGDVVAARFSVSPRDAMAEYARVSTTVCDKVADTKLIPPVDAAALASASPAVCVSDLVQPGERILIMGAGGGVGSHLCQLARLRGASYICGVSETPQRLLEAPLSCDDAIDYSKENALDSLKYQKEPFDTIIDLAAAGTWLQLQDAARQNRPSIVKPLSQGGRYITLTGDAPTFEGRSIFTVLYLFLFKPMGRSIWSRLFTRRTMPAFTMANGLPPNREIITRTLTLAQEGKLKAVVDGPYPLSTEGVRKAFRIQESRHPKGKVVVKVADFPIE
jgi:NADPH:quinone reductase-like Zn-dependent oxidoreductase